MLIKATAAARILFEISSVKNLGISFTISSAIFLKEEKYSAIEAESIPSTIAGPAKDLDLSVVFESIPQQKKSKPITSIPPIVPNASHLREARIIGIDMARQRSVKKKVKTDLLRYTNGRKAIAAAIGYHQ